MNCEIFVVSFHRDLEFLRYLLRSIEKFCTGFAGVTVAVPDYEAGIFAFVADYGAKLKTYQEWSGNKFMHHADQILNADHWCPQADAILFADSDCLFWEPATPADYFVNFKPILYRERYETLTNKLRLNWRTATANATGMYPTFETMVRHPSVHLPVVLAKTRQLISEYTGMPSTLYVNGCDGTFPQKFAEFPALGAVAIEFFADKYHFVDYDVRTPDGGYDYQRGRDKLTAHWSHGGIERYREQCEAILK